MGSPPALILHGGCGTYDEREPIERHHQAEQVAGMSRAIEEGWKMLSLGASAVDTVERVVNLLEECPAFNAGIGSAIGSDMQIEVDASIMNGRDLACGAVAGLSCIPNAISIARRVMDQSPCVFLAGAGADEFAERENFSKLPVEKFYTDYSLHWWNKLGAWRRVDETVPEPGSKGTVGAVALDRHGDIAAATSTGGVTRKPRGRVGDSPIIGAGTYADNRFGGGSATGCGEQIIKVSLTKTAIDLVRFRNASAQEACDEMITELGTLTKGKGGIIFIDPLGRVGASCNEKFMARAYMTAALKAPVVGF